MAYPANYVPPTGLAGAQVNFATATTSTNSTGAFSLRSSQTLGVDYLPLAVTAQGHASSWLPWTPPDSALPLSVGLYRERVVTPRLGMMKALVYTDGGGNIPGWFNANGVPNTAERARSVVHANTMAYVTTLSISAYDTSALRFDAIEDPGVTEWTTIFPAVSTAVQTRGMQRMLRIKLFSRNASQNPSAVPASNTAFWDVVFARVLAFVSQRASSAHQLGFEHLFIDLPAYMMSKGTARLRPIYEAARATGFRGKIYAGFNANFSREPVPLRFYTLPTADFWPLVDGAVVFVGNVVFRPQGVTGPLPRAISREQMRQGIRYLLDDMALLPVPVILELNPASIHGAASVGDDVEFGFRSLVRDYQQQADIYQAAAEEIDRRPVRSGPGDIIGLMSWNYLWNDNLREFEYWGRPEAWDKYSSVRGKPAEAVLRWWFDRW